MKYESGTCKYVLGPKVYTITFCKLRISFTHSFFCLVVTFLSIFAFHTRKNLSFFFNIEKGRSNKSAFVQNFFPPGKVVIPSLISVNFKKLRKVLVNHVECIET